MFKNFTYTLVIATATFLMGCNTIGGTLSGAGKDIQQASEWFKTK